MTCLIKIATTIKNKLTDKPHGPTAWDRGPSDSS